MPYIDFAALKQQYPIDQVSCLVGLSLKPSGEQLRGKCPACDSDNERTLVVTPSNNIFYCHDAKEGGDQIALVSHIRGVGMKQAAEFIVGGTNNDSSPEEDTGTRTSTSLSSPFPLEYLVYDHELVQSIGFPALTAETLGIGYAPKGIMRGKVAVPIYSDGNIVGYIGITEAKLPPRWQL